MASTVDASADERSAAVKPEFEFKKEHIA